MISVLLLALNSSNRACIATVSTGIERRRWQLRAC